jgi:hypothetical protein
MVSGGDYGGKFTTVDHTPLNMGYTPPRRQQSRRCLHTYRLGCSLRSLDTWLRLGLAGLLAACSAFRWRLECIQGLLVIAR